MTQATAPPPIPFALKPLFDEFPQVRLSRECLENIGKIDGIAKQILENLQLPPQERNQEVLCHQVTELKKFASFSEQLPGLLSYIRKKPPSEDTLKSMYASAAVIAAWQTPKENYEENRDSFLKTFIQFRCRAMHWSKTLEPEMELDELRDQLLLDPFWRENRDLLQTASSFRVPVHVWGRI